MRLAGVDLEEAAGKWRAGDATKSMRFFAKALDTYDEGLRKFPTSLDLAYNKLVSSDIKVSFETRLTPVYLGHESFWRSLLIQS